MNQYYIPSYASMGGTAVQGSVMPVKGTKRRSKIPKNLYSYHHHHQKSASQPLTRYLMQKRAAVPPESQTKAIIADGNKKKKKGLGTGAKLLGGAALLGAGLATGKVQAAGKLLKDLAKNPATGKYDPLGMVSRGYRDMGHGKGSRKVFKMQDDVVRTGVDKGNVYNYTAAGPNANPLRKGGYLSAGKKFEGTMTPEQVANVRQTLKAKHPEAFDTATGKLLSPDKMPPELSQKLYNTYRGEVSKLSLGEGTAFQRANLGMYLPGEKTFIGGLTGLGVAGELGTTQDADGRKRSLSERMIRAGTVGAAGVALNPLFAAHSLIPGFIAFDAANRAAGAVGGVAGRAATGVSGGEVGSIGGEIKSHIPFAGGGQ